METITLNIVILYTKMKERLFQLHITVPMVTNSSELTDFVDSIATFQPFRVRNHI